MDIGRRLDSSLDRAVPGRRPNGSNMNQAPSPLKTYIVAWSCLLAVIASGVIVYDGVDLYTSGSLYLLFSVAAFSIGYCTAQRYKIALTKLPHSRPVRVMTWADETRRYRRLISALAACGIIASVLFAIEMLVFSGVSSSNLGNIREIFLQRDVTILAQIAAILGAGGYFSLVAVIICWDFIPNTTRFLWLLSPISLSLFSVLSAGRQTVLQILLFVFFSLLLRHKIFKTSIRQSIGANAIFALVFVIILAYGMLAAFQRNAQQGEIAKKEIVLDLMQAHLNPKIDTMIDGMPVVLRDGSAELLAYFTHTVPNFLVFWEQPNKPGPYWGLWEFPFVARRLHSLGMVKESDVDRMDFVTSAYAAESGRFALIWLTQLRDMILDFTPTGAIIVLSLFGFLCGRVVSNYENNGGFVLALLVVGLNVLCFYSILLSVISDTFMFFYFLGSLILLFYSMLSRDCDFIVTSDKCLTEPSD